MRNESVVGAGRGAQHEAVVDFLDTLDGPHRPEQFLHFRRGNPPAEHHAATSATHADAMGIPHRARNGGGDASDHGILRGA